MNEQWQGCRVSNRLNLWYDDDMRHWVLSGKDDRDDATGTAGEMVRLATAILENLPDTGENGPPLGLNEECEAQPPAAAGLLAAAVDLARNRTGSMTGEQYTRLAGALMATAVHMLQSQAEAVWTSCRDPRFPFRMRLETSEEEEI